MEEMETQPAIFSGGRFTSVQSARCPPAEPPHSQIFDGENPAMRENSSEKSQFAAARQSSPQAGQRLVSEARR